MLSLGLEKKNFSVKSQLCEVFSLVRGCIGPIVFLGLIFVQSFANAQSTGSGFLVSSQGHVVTNYHVISDAQAIFVRTKNGKSYPATIVRIDSSNDLAVLKIEEQTPYLMIASSSEVKKGERVFTMGFPLASLQGEQESKITDGLISSLSGILGQPNNFQISVPLQPGNSGGPLISSTGAVVGVVVAKLNAKLALKLSGTLPENVNYAVKSNYLVEILDIAGVPYKRVSHSSGKAVPVNSLVDAVDASVVFIVALSEGVVATDQGASNDDSVTAKEQRSYYEVGYVDSVRLKGQTKLSVDSINRQIVEFSKKFDIDIIFQKAVWVSRDRDMTDRFASFLKDGRFPEKPYVDYGSPSKLGFVDTARILELKDKWRGPLGIFSTDKQKQEALTRAANLKIFAYAEANGYDLVFQEAVYASQGINLTNEIVESLRKEMSN